jgi:hypothetical protein
MNKNLLFVIFFLCGVQSSLCGCAQAQSQTHRARLKQPAQIQDYPCAKGFAWFFVDGRLNRCTVSEETTFGEARIPAGTYIALNPDGAPAFVQLPHNASILGMTCMGAVGWVLAKAQRWASTPAASSRSVTWQATRPCRGFLA